MHLSKLRSKLLLRFDNMNTDTGARNDQNVQYIIAHDESALQLIGINLSLGFHFEKEKAVRV